MSVREPNVEDIIWAVSKESGITEEEIKSKDRSTKILIARQVAMALARELTSNSYKTIGEAFPRSHATVLHASRKIIREMAEGNAKINKLYTESKAHIASIVGEDLLGLTCQEALLILKREGKTVRVIMQDGKNLVGTRDYNKQRINVSIVSGVIDEILGSW